MAVTVADSRKMTSTHMCHGFTWWVQHLKFTFDLRVLDMGSFDIILGVNWMKLFDPILFDFHHSTVTFKEGRLITLQGMEL